MNFLISSHHLLTRYHGLDSSRSYLSLRRDRIILRRISRSVIRRRYQALLRLLAVDWLLVLILSLILTVFRILIIFRRLGLICIKVKILLGYHLLMTLLVMKVWLVAIITGLMVILRLRSQVLLIVGRPIVILGCIWILRSKLWRR